MGIIVTADLMEQVNGILGAEFIPECAVGNEICYADGSIVVKTFREGRLEGYRSLSSCGELVNIITEFCGR